MKVYLVTQRAWNTVGYNVLAVYTSESLAAGAVALLEEAQANGDIQYIEREVKDWKATGEQL